MFLRDSDLKEQRTSGGDYRSDRWSKEHSKFSLGMVVSSAGAGTFAVGLVDGRVPIADSLFSGVGDGNRM